MANKPEETRFPTLPDSWATGVGRAPAPPPTGKHGDAASAVPRWEKQRRDITSALLVFLFAAVAFHVLDYRTVLTGTLGVCAGWAIRLFLLERKIARLRDHG